MILEHVAIWTNELERLRAYYIKYFKGVSNAKYINEKKGFESYFISFETGARLELMSRPGIPENINDPQAQYTGIIHLAFGVETMDEVDLKCEELKADGFLILSGPRKTGDGYYEFETLDPDSNRLEVTTLYREDKNMTVLIL
jgi:lactoylglutathione lyase